MHEELTHLSGVWKAQQDLLDQKLQYQMFLQDVDNLEAMCATHEVSMSAWTQSLYIYCNNN